jgi:hypothetical protein
MLGDDVMPSSCELAPMVGSRLCFVTTCVQKKLRFLPPGGLAPCLSASIAGLIERYTQVAADIQIICYRGGYKGLCLETA